VIWPDSATLIGDDNGVITQIAESGYVMFKTVGHRRPAEAARHSHKRATRYIVELLDGSPSETEVPSQTIDLG
jgi:hypothetical protein